MLSRSGCLRPRQPDFEIIALVPFQLALVLKPPHHNAGRNAKPGRQSPDGGLAIVAPLHKLRQVCRRNQRVGGELVRFVFLVAVSVAAFEKDIPFAVQKNVAGFVEEGEPQLRQLPWFCLLPGTSCRAR